MRDLERSIYARQTAAGVVYDVRVTIKGHGRKFKGGFKSRQAAAAWRDKVEGAANAEALLRQERLMLPKLVEVWISATTDDKSGATLIAQRSALKNHIAPHLNVPVDHVTGKILGKFVDELPARLPSGGNGWSTAKRVVGMVKAALRWAARPDVQLIERNPLRDVPVRLPGQDQTRRAVDGSDFVKLMRATKDAQHRLLWFLLGYTGARRGEVTALRWSDIDLDRGELHIRRIATPESKGRQVEEGRVKMGQVRTIPIDDRLLGALRRARQATGGPASAYIFPSPRTQGPIGFSAVQRWWEADCAAAGLPTGRGGYTIHGLRHMFTTLLLDGGEDLKVVSKILGHSNTKTTQDIYRQVNDSHKKKSIQRLTDLLGEEDW